MNPATLTGPALDAAVNAVLDRPVNPLIAQRPSLIAASALRAMEELRLNWTADCCSTALTGEHGTDEDGVPRETPMNPIPSWYCGQHGYANQWQCTFYYLTRIPGVVVHDCRGDGDTMAEAICRAIVAYGELERGE